MRKILLTGGSGMVGQNIIHHYKSNDWVINAPTKKELNLENFDAVSTYISNFNPDLVINAAAKVGGILDNINNPIDFLIKNIDISRNVIMASKINKVKKLLNFGSSCIYPKDKNGELFEDDILSGKLEPTNEGYAISKIFSARLCEYISKSNKNYLYKTVIPCNLYGKYDNFSPDSSHLIPGIINKIHNAKISNNPKVVMWGNGEARREFMYAEDLVDAIFICIENYEKIPNLINIGLGFDYSVHDYYTKVSDVIGFKIQICKDLSKPSGMNRKLVNISNLKKLGWKPKYSLKEGIELTYKYYLDNEYSR